LLADCPDFRDAGGDYVVIVRVPVEHDTQWCGDVLEEDSRQGTGVLIGELVTKRRRSPESLGCGGEEVAFSAVQTQSIAQAFAGGPIQRLRPSLGVRRDGGGRGCDVLPRAQV
jgi:hypothetical protein